MIGVHPWVRLISAGQIIELHTDLIKRYGGDPTPSETSVKDGCIERSLGAAWNAELYAGVEESTPGLIFAGCLLFYLAKNHCFIDGNKRISWAASMRVLLGLDLTLDVSEPEAEAYCLSILAGEIQSATDVASWMADRLIAIEED